MYLMGLFNPVVDLVLFLLCHIERYSPRMAPVMNEYLEIAIHGMLMNSRKCLKTVASLCATMDAEFVLTKTKFTIKDPLLLLGE